MIEQLTSNNAETFLQEDSETRAGIRYQISSLEELAQRPLAHELNIKPLEGVQHKAARQATFEPLTRRTAPEQQIRAIYEEIYNRAHEMMLAKPSMVNAMMDCLRCPPAGTEVTVGPEHEQWQSSPCGQPLLCPWCHYREFLKVYGEISKTELVTALDIDTTGAFVPMEYVRDRLHDSMALLRSRSVRAWMRAWPDFSSEAWDCDDFPLRASLVIASSEPPEAELVSGYQDWCRVIYPMAGSRFAELQLPRMYRLNGHMFPDWNHVRWLEEYLGVVCDWGFVERVGHRSRVNAPRRRSEARDVAVYRSPFESE